MSLSLDITFLPQEQEVNHSKISILKHLNLDLVIEAGALSYGKSYFQLVTGESSHPPASADPNYVENAHPPLNSLLKLVDRLMGRAGRSDIGTG